MLEESLKQQLGQYLARLTRDVQIIAYTDDSEASGQLRELLEDVRGQSNRIQILEGNDPEIRRPSFYLASPGQDIKLGFAGLPLGHEFTSLVLALLQVGGHPSREAAGLLEQVAALEGSYVFETYYSLSCQNCPDVVQALNLAATLNPNISHVAIDGALFQEEVQSRQVMSVPSVFLNGELFGQGRMNLRQIVSKLDVASQQSQAEQIAAKAAFDILVVGGGPAGSAAAIYAARKGIRTGVLAQRFGGQVLDTLAIENFISVSHTEGPKLATALEQHVLEYGVDLMDNQQAVELIPANGDGLVQVRLSNGAVVKSQAVVLSTGARWRKMGVPGEEEYRNRGVAYCPHCDGPLFKGKRVAVIGGGNSGVEAAIDLAGIVEHVTLLEFDARLRADQVLQKKLRSLPNIEVLTSAQTTEVLGDGSKVMGLMYKNRQTGEDKRLDVAGIFVQIGLLPNTDWLDGVVQLSTRGEIVVDDRGQTSLPGVFAAGDCTTVPYKQIIVAMGQGATASLSAFDFLIRKGSEADR